MKLGIWVLGSVVACALFSGCGKKEPQTTDGAAAFDSQWTSEEHWMVSNVVGDLQSMVVLAGGKLAEGVVKPAEKPHAFTVGSTDLVMAPSCWDTASYGKLLAAWKPTAAASTETGPDLLHDLLTPTATVMQKANVAISTRIKNSPSDPQVHEEAAFLLGVMGLREYSRQFSDVRPLLCRMTAHLVMAKHLRAGAEISAPGKWADVLYEMHAGRPRKALDLAGAIPMEGDAGRWKRVVEMMVTGDWRRGGELPDPTLAETIAHCRALKLHRGNAVMLEVASGSKDLQAIPEWSRELAAQGKSVEEGHLAMRSALHMEFIEMAEVFPVGKDPSPDKVTKHLAAESPMALIGKDGAPKVISDGDWAAYFRRHLFAAGADIARFTLRQWGSDEAAVEWEKSVLPYFGPLPGHELVEPLIATRASGYQQDLKKTAEYIRKHPEQVPTALWFDYRFPVLQVEADTAMPEQAPWFREVSPPGTAHDPSRRIRFTGIHGGHWVNHIRELHQIDPWNTLLAFELAENSGNDAKSIEDSWGDMRQYSVKPLAQMLTITSLTPEKRVETLTTLAQFDPEYSLDLGFMLAFLGRPEEAIKAYETAFNDSTDRVAVANKTQWMIYYYKSKGMDAKAREIADHNAEVYSHTGLASALSLAVVENDGARAKDLAQAIHERYRDPAYLVAAVWDGGANVKALKGVFPEGLKEVTVADLESTAKLKGVRIEENALPARLSGLKAGDVVLAIDGKRVENTAQYFTLLCTSLDPKVRLIYKRGKKVAEVECFLPNRRLGSGVVNFGS